ncbi:hypothetical protein PFISCL1PPCAC_14044, partial [Pristionchus fissidentatus]
AGAAGAADSPGGIPSTSGNGGGSRAGTRRRNSSQPASSSSRVSAGSVAKKPRSSEDSEDELPSNAAGASPAPRSANPRQQPIRVPPRSSSHTPHARGAGAAPPPPARPSPSDTRRVSSRTNSSPSRAPQGPVRVSQSPPRAGQASLGARQVPPRAHQTSLRGGALSSGASRPPSHARTSKFPLPTTGPRGASLGQMAGAGPSLSRPDNIVFAPQDPNLDSPSYPNPPPMPSLLTPLASNLSLDGGGPGAASSSSTERIDQWNMQSSVKSNYPPFVHNDEEEPGEKKKGKKNGKKEEEKGKKK